MPLPQKKLIPGLLLALAIATLAAPPLWWSAGDPPVIAPGAPENNHAPANIGQAKHMAKSALDALRPVLPDVADQIEADLTEVRPNPQDPANPLPPLLILQVPNPKTPEWLEKQKAPRANVRRGGLCLAALGGLKVGCFQIAELELGAPRPALPRTGPASSSRRRGARPPRPGVWE